MISNAQARADGLAEVRSALNLDQDLPEARATLGYIHFIYDWDWVGAEREFKRSLELNPSSPYARTFYAEFLAALGRFDEALVQTDTAKRLDPESGAAARRHALVMYYGRDFTGAEQALREGIAIEPNAASAWLLEARIHEAHRRFKDALEATRRAAELSGGGGVPLRVNLVRLQALAGQRDEARADLLELQREADAQTIRLSSRDEAYVHLALGNKDAALSSFARAVGDRDPTVVWVGVDPRLDPIRGDPRFRELLAKIGLPIRP
jgi:tetratricopeptide (TPR) repeat protein